MSKIIVITGAGAGLGRALARRFAADGDSVVLLGRTAEKVEKVARELGKGALALGCDVSSPESVREAFAAIARRHPRFDVLINNAAFYQPFPVAEATDEQIVRTLSTNLMGPIFCSRAAIPMMGRGGHIINVSSEVVEVPYPLFTLYQSSKAGLERFSDGLGRELAPSGIRVSTVRAGQMMDAEKTWELDPAVAARFHQASLAAGINLREQAITQYVSVTGVFRALIDLPADLHIPSVMLRARAAD